MKQNYGILFLLIPLFFLMNCETGSRSGGYKIDGLLSGVDDSTKIRLMRVVEGNILPYDSTYIFNSAFVFTGKVKTPEMMYIQPDGTNKMINLFVENSDISVHGFIGDLPGIQVKGSKTHDELVTFTKYLKPVDREARALDSLYGVYSEQEKIQEIDSFRTKLYEKQISMIKNYIKGKSRSYLTPFIIDTYLAYDIGCAQLDSLLSDIDQSIRDSNYYARLKQRLTILKSLEPGQMAKEITLKDTTGTEIALSGLKGKYILIDFWASWCPACREKNPELVRLYQEFHNKDFEIFSVSLDKEKQSWANAINQDKLTWLHGSDLSGWGSPVCKEYGIFSIPSTVLIDKDGSIVAWNLETDDLRQILSKLKVKS